jgi:hypothetical protein
MKQYQVRSRLDLLQTNWIKGDGVYHRYDSLLSYFYCKALPSDRNTKLFILDFDAHC